MQGCHCRLQKMPAACSMIVPGQCPKEAKMALELGNLLSGGASNENSDCFHAHFENHFSNQIQSPKWQLDESGWLLEDNEDTLAVCWYNIGLFPLERSFPIADTRPIHTLTRPGSGQGLNIPFFRFGVDCVPQCIVWVIFKRYPRRWVPLSMFLSKPFLRISSETQFLPFPQLHQDDVYSKRIDMDHTTAPDCMVPSL